MSNFLFPCRAWTSSARVVQSFFFATDNLTTLTYYIGFSSLLFFWSTVFSPFLFFALSIAPVHALFHSFTLS